jgi:hypothetical protein
MEQGSHARGNVRCNQAQAGLLWVAAQVSSGFDWENAPAPVLETEEQEAKDLLTP